MAFVLVQSGDVHVYNSLSTDIKPIVNINTGATCRETDTGDNYIFTGTAWQYDNSNLLGVLSDSRIMRKWFDGGVSGKSVMWSGDSTTLNLTTYLAGGLKEDGSPGRAQAFFPELNDVSVYARGTNGATAASFIAGNLAAGYNLDDILALDMDAYVYCWLINDCRTTDPAVFTAANARALLVTIIERTRAARPNAVIVMRVPNAHEDGAALITGAATAQNMMDRYQEAYRGLDALYDNVIVWDSQNQLYSNTANAAGGSDNKLINADGLHPSNSGYDLTILSIMRMFTPLENYPDADVAREASLGSPLTLDPNVGHMQWNTDYDPKILEGDDWYKVYRVLFEKQTDDSLYDLQFYDHLGSADSTAAAHATASVAPGMVIGDIISFNNIQAPNGTFVINKNIPAASGSRVRFLYSSASNPEHPSKVNSVNDNTDLLPDATRGFVYRHKYAFCEGMRYLKTLIDAEHQTEYEIASGLVDPYAVARRFYIAGATDGTLLVQTIGSEDTGDLSAKAWNASTDKLCIPGVSGGGTTVGPNSFALDLTGATFDTTTYAALQQVEITLAGVDFRDYTIPQGYVLSAS